MVRAVTLFGLFATMLVLTSGCGERSSPPLVGAAAPAIETASTSDRSDSVIAQKKEPAAAASIDTAPGTEGREFPFPDDAGGEALARDLTPTVPPIMPSSDPVKPRPRSVSDRFMVPELPVPEAGGLPPRLPMPHSKTPRPMPLPDRVPPDLGGPEPERPARSELSAGPLTRTEGRDVSRPVDLPFLSVKPVVDRAPLADPTVEFTARSVISSNLPLREAPADFVRINIPDPFEHSAAARPRTSIVEDPNRAIGNPPPPR